MQEWYQFLKVGDLSNPTNYRPISILPILSEVLEKHVHGIISDHLLLHSPISDQQWGFTTRKSTTAAAVLSMTHDCTQALDRQRQGSFYSFSLILAKPLTVFPTFHFSGDWQSLISIRVSESGFIAIYQAENNGAKSTVLRVVSGVPGPLLFLIYINEVTCVVSNGKMVVHGDDIALYQIVVS